MEAVMENLDNEHENPTLETPQADAEQAPRNTPLIDRASTSLGDMLIRVGTRLKERAHSKLTTEEGSPPSFIIML
jgi:hypothetical protein